MKNFLLLFHILLKLHCSSTEMSVSCPVSLVVHRHSVDLALATVQLATVWVMSKSQHFLSSWSLNKFLLITQGDLAVLRESSEMLLCQMKSVVMTSSDCSQSTSLNHSHLLLRQQIQRLDQAVTQLQTFSSTVLNMFSNHCKRKSGQIFEQTMPPSSHWRPSRRTGFPSSSSDYVSVAAGSVIGQVLECVALLSDDAGVQALSITTTAFLEAWMEHILREKIKFSVQGALQLKQDFDTIREMIQSHEYGLSADLLQQLLSLRVFQQVDSAVMCLLQQPQSKPYLSSRTWLPFIRCCPAHSSTDSLHAAVGSSITNLRSVEAQECDTRTAELQGGGTSAPGEPYLAPSLTLDAAQQQWLDLRMSSSDHRWRMQRFRRLFNSNLNTHPAEM
ncbi:coiled-coil domain-containing protein 142 [Cynoglossus semilaevis]|uniref:coiled-coil domain-containing protein 142 n=1 Tax=Cynoglossus semilaevis TaxID=244447 RepID=UPI0007DC969C|nr:coiled-coil domain-containing protein 142 [Cynoglossus semilaevis]